MFTPPDQEDSLAKIAVNLLDFPFLPSANAVPAKGLRSALKSPNKDVCERARSCTALITVIDSSCFQAGVFQPRVLFSRCSASYSLRNVSLIVLHNPNLLCSPERPIVPLIKRVLATRSRRALLLTPDLLFLPGSAGPNNL